MADASSSLHVVDEALARGDAKGAAAAAQEGLRAAVYDERKRYFTQLCALLLRRARTADRAACVSEAGELLWAMPDFRSSSAATSSVSGETLLLAAALAAAYMTQHNHEKVLAFDRELLQSPAFFTYEGLTPVERLACVARVLTASRLSGENRFVDSAVHKGMSLYHSLVKSRAKLSEAEQAHRNAVVCTYLFELAHCRQEQKDYLRAYQSFFALHEANHEPEALCRAALCALCARANEGVRHGALHDILRSTSPAALPSLYHHVQRAYNCQLFGAADTQAVLAAAGSLVPTAVLRDALREHNICLLAQTFDCVHWRSLAAHMDDADVQEGELYSLIVGMVRAQRLAAAIHQDTGFIEFGEGEAGAEQRHISDADVFNRIAATTAAIVVARPELRA